MLVTSAGWYYDPASLSVCLFVRSFIRWQPGEGLDPEVVPSATNVGLVFLLLASYVPNVAKRSI